MMWLRVFLHRLGSLFLKSRLERELEEEIRTHLELQTEENLRQGMSKDEARFAALRKFGGVEQMKEQYRDRRGLPLLESLFQDLRYGARMLRKNPGFTLIAVLTLALGIGATTAIFSVVNGVLLRPLPYPEAERLMSLTERSPQLERNFIAYPNLLDWRAQNTVFEQIAVYRTTNFTITGKGEPERVIGGQVSAELFPALRVSATLGRTFLTEEDKPGGNPVVLLSHGLWQRRFGADPSIIGQSLSLNGRNWQVAGVMPARFQFPNRVELWTPLGQTLDDPDWMHRGNHQGIYGLARLKPGATLTQARSEMEAIAVRLEQQYPATNQGARVSVVPLLEETVQDVRRALLVLLATVGFVLLIACANIANLLLARAATRQKEMAIRLALGASRGRLLRQLLAESALLALLGGSVGLWLAARGVALIVAANASGPSAIPRAQEIGLDWQVVIFTTAISLLTSLLFGLAPAWQASKPALNETLKEASRGTTGGPGQHRLRGALVIAEVALSLVLLIGAGLMLRSFYNLQRVNPGFQTDHLLTLRVALPPARYTTAEQIGNFYQQLLQRLNALPGVQSVGAATWMPLVGGGNNSPFSVEGQPEPEPGEAPLADISNITPDYFRLMGIALQQGRAFTEQDNLNAPLVVILDELTAQRHWPNTDPIGKRIRLGGNNPAAPWATVVGIVPPVKLYGLARASNHAQVYRSLLQFPQPTATIGVRAAADPVSLNTTVRQQVLALDGDLPIFNVKTMEQVLTDSVASQRLNTLLLGIFAAVAFILAAVGIYGVMSYLVAQRTQEIGIRLALGAQALDVLKHVLRQGMTLTLIGISLGLAGALALTRFMTTLLFGVNATDSLTFAVITVLLALVALLACLVPARRATKVDPMIALRHE
jgi:predicted permease